MATVLATRVTCLLSGIRRSCCRGFRGTSCRIQKFLELFQAVGVPLRASGPRAKFLDLPSELLAAHLLRPVRQAVDSLLGGRPVLTERDQHRPEFAVLLHRESGLPQLLGRRRSAGGVVDSSEILGVQRTAGILHADDRDSRALAVGDH